VHLRPADPFGPPGSPGSGSLFWALRFVKEIRKKSETAGLLPLQAPAGAFCDLGPAKLDRRDLHAGWARG
jgi:hypothetical protein